MLKTRRIFPVVLIEYWPVIYIDGLRKSRQFFVFKFFFIRTTVKRQRGTARFRPPHCCAPCSNRSMSPAGRAHSSDVCGCEQTDRRTDRDGQTDRQTDRRTRVRCIDPAAHTVLGVSAMPNSHRPPDTTRQSCLRRVWCAGVNWTIALNVLRLRISCRATVLSCRESSSRRRLGRNTDKTVLSCLAWR